MRSNKTELHVPFGVNTHIIVNQHPSSAPHVEIHVLNAQQYKKRQIPEADEMAKKTKEEFTKIADATIKKFKPLLDGMAAVFGDEFVGLTTSGNVPGVVSKAQGSTGTWTQFGSTLQTLCMLPEVEIHNEYNLSIKARDLCIRISVEEMGANYFKFANFSGIRYTLSLREAGGGYSHSHLPGIRGFFNNFCLGHSELANMMHTRVNHSGIEYFAALTFAMAGTESISGSPYRRLDTVLDTAAALNNIMTGQNRRTQQHPQPNYKDVTKMMKDIHAAGKEFPLELVNTDDFGGKIRLRPGSDDELIEFIEEFAPNRIKVTARETTSELSEDAVRGMIPPVENVPPIDRYIFNGVLYNKVDIVMDQEEIDILAPIEAKVLDKKEKPRLPNTTRDWLRRNIKTAINKRLENEPRWNV